MYNEDIILGKLRKNSAQLDDMATYVTPEMFGAKGDGVTDDTLAFTNALNYSSSVKCMPGKTYYFAGFVDAKNLWRGVLDLNRSLLKNFHIKINLKDNGYQARVEWPIGYFKICNGSIGGDYSLPSVDWIIPSIQTGANMLLQDLTFYTCPYMMAMTNNYRDFMRYDNISQSCGYTFAAGDITLNGISGIVGDGQFAKMDTSTFQNISNTSGQGISGDGWIFESCNEWHFTNNPSYSFVDGVRNQSFTAINCIQTRFTLGAYTKATFISCHWENVDTLPIIGTTYMKQAIFISCYFYGSYILETATSKITYLNCFFRVAGELTTALKNTPFSYNLNNTDIYHIRCKIINCLFGSSYVFNSDTFKLWKSLPKWTANSISMVSGRTLLSTLSATGTLASGTYMFPELGDYVYKIYLFATGKSIATDSVQLTRTIPVISTSGFSIGSLWGHTGGWGFVMFRTLPSGVIQKSEFWFEPSAEYTGSTYNLPIRFTDFGHWCQFEIPDTDVFITPWITVSAVTSYTVNAKVFEKNGVLITTDNTTLSLPSTDAYVQVANTYIPAV